VPAEELDGAEFSALQHVGALAVSVSGLSHFNSPEISKYAETRRALTPRPKGALLQILPTAY
jgi:hypothetical protein